MNKNNLFEDIWPGFELKSSQINKTVDKLNILQKVPVSIRLKKTQKTSLNEKNTKYKKSSGKSIATRKSFNFSDLLVKTYNARTPTCKAKLSEVYNFSSKLRKSPKLKTNFKDFQGIQEKIESGNYSEALQIIETMKDHKKNKKIRTAEVFCCFRQGKLEKAFEILEDLIKRKGIKSSKLFALMIETLESLSRTEELRIFLQLAVETYPDNQFIAKKSGNMFFQAKNYKKCKKVLKNLQDEESLYFFFESLRKLKLFEKSSKSLKALVLSSQLEHLVQGKLCYSQENYSKSLIFLSEIQEKSRFFHESAFYTGKCLLKTGNFESSELFLEKVALFSSDKDLVFRSIIRITALKLNFNDFYGAHHSMLRAKGTPCLTANKKRIKAFSHAGYQMMQNLPGEAIETLDLLIESETSEDFLYRFLILRAFCHFSMENYEKSQEDYEKAQNIRSLDSASANNLDLSRVTQVFLSGDYEKCEKMLNIQKSSPVMLKIIYLLINSFKHSTLDNPKHLLELIQTGKKLQADHEVIKILSFFYYIQKDFEKSLKILERSSIKTDITKIIESFNYISLQSYQEAQEILTSIDLESSNNKFAIYPYRALSSAYMKNRSNSLQDIYKIINENSYQAYLLSIYLLIVANEIKEALLVISITEKTVEVQLLQAHCLLLNFELEESEQVLKAVELKSVKNDLLIIQSIKTGKLQAQHPGVIFNERYVLWIQAIQMFYAQDYSQAAQSFEETQNMLHKTQTGQFFLFNPGYLLEYSLINFNLALCLIAKDDPEHLKPDSLKTATKLLKEIIKFQKSSLSEQVLLYFLLEKQKKTLKAQKTLNEIRSYSRKTYENIVDSKEISIFPEYSCWRLKNILPSVRLKLLPALMISPCFIFPVMQPPLDFNDSCMVIQKLFQKLRPKPRPEVPWLEKIGNTYKFTDSIIEETQTGSFSASKAK